jgi:hypothetical protein
MQIKIKTYKFKLYRSKKNKHLHQQINISGLIYNHCIALAQAGTIACSARA